MLNFYRNRLGIKAKTFSVKLNGKIKRLNVDDLLLFIISNYVNYDLKDDNLSIMGLKKDEFFYCLKKFIFRYELLDDKFIFEPINVFMDKVVKDVYANTTPYFFTQETKDDNLASANINPKLIDYILSEMPKSYSDVEKAIYVYIKLCKTLSYDPEFYASNQRGMIARIHSDIEHLSTITPTSNQIVCYEFTQIYAKILNTLGITYSITGRSEYGSAHNKLLFSANEFVVSADSVSSIIGGDLFNAKVNRALLGIECRNKNAETKAKFLKTLNLVYDDIIKTEASTEAEECKFEDFLSMFDNWCEAEEIDMETKLRVFEKQTSKIELPKIEKIAYMKRLADAIFEQEIQKGEFNICIISQKVVEGLQIKNMPAIVFSYSPYGLYDATFNIQYKLVDAKGNVSDITQGQIYDRFNSGHFHYITAGTKRKRSIPGINIMEDIKC